jgi:uncharacterized protein (UPF0332 family)
LSTDETQALRDKARENLRAANLLRREDFLDIAASRVYFAMFYAAEALLLSGGHSLSSHSAVIAAFGREFAKTQRLDARFHRYLIDAQHLRQSGDYSTDTPVTAERGLRSSAHPAFAPQTRGGCRRARP